MDPTMGLSPDCLELLTLFRSSGVEFLVVGGRAMAAHGMPRFTEDVDLLVRPTPENIGRLLKALEEFGLGALSVNVADLARPNVMIRIGRPPNQVDIMTAITGVSVDEAFAEPIEISLAPGIEVPVISRRLLGQNKRATGRGQDLVDADLIERYEKKHGKPGAE
jgi:hypothetical protein